MHLTFDLIDFTNEEHVDYVLQHLEYYTEEELTNIYNILDLEITRKAWDTYCNYNVHDVRLIYKLDDKLKLIELVYAMAYDAGVNFQDTFTTVGLWDVIIHNHLMRKSIVVHQAVRQGDKESILGGYVKDPTPGMYNWVVSLDLNSLYPHIIMQYNISPETFVGWIPEEGECQNKDQAEARVLRILDGAFNDYRDLFEKRNVTATANMCLFSREKQGFLPALMQRMYSDRVIFKDQMIEAKKAYEALADKTSEEANQLVKDISKFNNLQMAKKIQMNSMYGSMANIWNRWFRREFAEGITSSGQLTTRWIERKLNVYLNKTLKTTGEDYVIACDTDSVYIRLDVLIDSIFTAEQQQNEKAKILKFMERLCKEKLEPFIDQCYDELAEYVNAYDQKMKMKRECIADKGIWTGKKHYILNVYNQEGVLYTQPKLKMMGIEAIRTSTPAVVRSGIKKALEIIMNKTEQDLQDYVADFRDEFCKMPFEQVAFPRSVRDLDKYKDVSSIYSKGTPINVKGALVYNHYLKKLKLDKKYEPVADGQKIKYAYLRSPNPVQSTVITCPDKLPLEMNLDKYVDKEMQFDKSFVEPIKKIVGAIGWEVEKRATLEDFFG